METVSKAAFEPRENKSEDRVSTRDLRSVGYRAPRFALAIAAIGLGFAVTVNGLDFSSGWPLLFALGGGLLLIAVLTQNPPDRVWSRAVPVLATVAIAYLWATAPAWLGSVAPSLARNYAAPDLVLPSLLGATGAVACFLSGAVLSGRRGAFNITFDWLVGFAVLNFVFGLILAASGADGPWNLWEIRPDGRFTGTTSNANVAGTYFAMTALLGLGVMITDDERTDDRPVAVDLLRGLGVAICVVGCLLTASRSAVGGLAIGAAAMGMLLFAQGTVRRSLWLLFAGLGGVAFLLASGLADMALTRFGLIGSESTDRLLMWTRFGAVALESPVFGYGMGGFDMVKQLAMDDPRTAQALWMVNSPHNLILRGVLIGGIPFLSLMLLVVAMVIVPIVRALRRAPSSRGRLGAAVAIALALWCAMVDIALDVPAIVALTAFLAGMLWRDSYSTSARSESPALTSRQRVMKD